MASFDMTSLYTNKALTEVLNREANLLYDLLKFTMFELFFKFGGKFYEQRKEWRSSGITDYI